MHEASQMMPPVIVKASQKCTRQADMEGQALSCPYLAYHEPDRNETVIVKC